MDGDYHDMQQFHKGRFLVLFLSIVTATAGSAQQINPYDTQRILSDYRSVGKPATFQASMPPNIFKTCLKPLLAKISLAEKLRFPALQ
jgi:hypothetical protein